MSQAQPLPLQKPSAIKTILTATLIAGTLDMLAAIVQTYINGRDPVRMFRFIASGIFGQEAFTGGTMMAVWGWVFHFLNAFLFSLFLFLVYPYLKKIFRNKILIGLLYGIFVWIIMNRIVLPLSNTPKFPFRLSQAIIGMLILMFMIGLPIALIVDRHYLRRGTRK